MKKSNFSFSKVTELSFEEAGEKVIEELKKEGFGVLADLNFSTILKTKLDVDFRPYRVLEACNPPSALKALRAEEQIGLLLPCNIIVYVDEEENTVVASIDPIANLSLVKNEIVQEVAETISDKLKNVIENI